MAVGPHDLENPERGLELANRKTDSTAARRALHDRLERARLLEPAARHWFASWVQGRDAAITAIEVAGNTASARALPTPEVINCGDCFRKGRDAVVRLVDEGT